MIEVIFTGVSAVFAGVSAYIAYRVDADQRRPKVIVYARMSETQPGLLMVSVKNIGEDPATNIRFEVSPHIPSREDRLMEALTKGVPILAPGESRNYSLGAGHTVVRDLGSEEYIVDYTYNWGRRRLKDSSVVEVASFTNTLVRP
ncbi:MAG: hypothetical protein OXH56_08985 [Gemmatimonadetes bacterium]|nr:hypothetical protein [Gemmatimonadota bacterium]